MAVGNRDICVADIWITPERNQLANFLPTVKSDTFYLVVPRKIEEITFYHRIARPFILSPGLRGLALVHSFLA